MGIWEGHRALLNSPLEIQIGGAGGRAGGVLCYVSSAIIGQELQQVLGNQLCQSCGANHIISDQTHTCLRGRKKKKKSPPHAHFLSITSLLL
jgi:hypothetical protein